MRGRGGVILGDATRTTAIEVSSFDGIILAPLYFPDNAISSLRSSAIAVAIGFLAKIVAFTLIAPGVMALGQFLTVLAQLLS